MTKANKRSRRTLGSLWDKTRARPDAGSTPMGLWERAAELRPRVWIVCESARDDRRNNAPNARQKRGKQFSSAEIYMSPSSLHVSTWAITTQRPPITRKCLPYKKCIYIYVTNMTALPSYCAIVWWEFHQKVRPIILINCKNPPLAHGKFDEGS